ncbi:MAG: hypothetical protein CHACPFDD_03116 [Phycisphaerae bacterium]|nr:hypothetical protein [Phycisphaerae bacterium]
MLFTDFLNQVFGLFSQLAQLWLSLVQQFFGLDLSAFMTG